MGSKRNNNNHKRPQRDIAITHLVLDTENPRLPVETQGKGQFELLRVLYRDFNVTELADSFANNGYFTEEPLVVIPNNLPKDLIGNSGSLDDSQYNAFIEFINDKATTFTVVEGNRRLATCKLLMDVELRGKIGIRQFPLLSPEIEQNLQKLPAIVYTSRGEVIPYLGVRHIVGIQKWDSFAKARYIAQLVEKGKTLKEVEELIGDKRGAARKNYVCYKMVEQLEDEIAFDTKKVKNKFSFLMLAIGQGSVKRFLGIPSRQVEVNLAAPVSPDKLSNLTLVASWIFGDDKYDAVIKESRDITNFLAHVLDSEIAVEHLKANRNLKDAYDLSDGEEAMLVRKLRQANSRLESALGIVHRHIKDDVIHEIDRSKDTVDQLILTIKRGS